MKFIPLELSGNLPDEIKDEYGGGFGILESLRMGGTGSRKLFLLKGPEDLKVLDEISVDFPTISFQHLPEALLIRINKSNKLFALIFRHEEIKNVEIALKTTEPEDNDPLSESLRVFLTINPIDLKGKLHFEAHHMDKKHFIKFFQKSPLPIQLDE